MQSTKKSRQQKMAKRDEAIPISIEDNPIQSHGPLLHTPADSTENDAPQDCISYFYENLSIIFSTLLVIITFPISFCFCFRTVNEFQRAVIFRMGRLRMGGARGPGVFFVLPCIDEFRVIDLRTTSCVVPPQEALTKDSVSVGVDAVVFYRVVDPLKAIVKVNNYNASTAMLAATTLRDVIGTKNLAQLLTDRVAVAYAMKETLDYATHQAWGVFVERVEMQDVKIPQAMQRIMAAEAEATREARAKVIAAEGEKKAAMALREASDIISQSQSALQLRYLQTISDISSNRSSTIIFPLPMELLRGFTTGSGSRK